MTAKDVREIVEAISLPEPLYAEVSDEMWLRVNGTDKAGYGWKGRKWLFSQFSVKSEIVQTVYLAAQTALEHELREHFRYNGQAIFSPHYDVDALAALSNLPTSHEVRA